LPPTSTSTLLNITFFSSCLIAAWLIHQKKQAYYCSIAAMIHLNGKSAPGLAPYLQLKDAKCIF